MSSVLDDLRRETNAAVLQMTPGARLALAFALGDDDLELFASAHGLTRDDARRQLRANRGAGRAPSIANLAQP